MTSTQPEAKRIVAEIEGKVLRGASAHRYRLIVSDLKPVRPRVGWLYITIALSDAGDRLSKSPLMMGIVSGGGRRVMPWVECRIYPALEWADGAILDARACGLEAALINLIGELIPPGGHLMVEYESPGQVETHAELLLRVPPAACYLGSLMFRAGFRGEFKDWYISEGGHEGPRKLQANKSPTLAAARAAMRNHVTELTAFAKRPLPDSPSDAAVVAGAQGRAREMLKELRR
jgi:hypothetical protein